jgi:hypothetical protein
MWAVHSRSVDGGEASRLSVLPFSAFHDTTARYPSPSCLRCIQILSRRSKNNPVLIGEPGVGKTAVAEGLAQVEKGLSGLSSSISAPPLISSLCLQSTPCCTITFPLALPLLIHHPSSFPFNSPQRIVSNDVPEALMGRTLMALDMGSLIAGGGGQKDHPVLTNVLSS